MVEGAALEMLFGGNFNEGSNPSLSVLINKISNELNIDEYISRCKVCFNYYFD